MPDDPQYRSTYDPRPDEMEVREAEASDEDGMMSIRLPIASTGEVRNDGDEPLTRAELDGMAEQVDSLTRGVFPEHGQSDVIDFAGYSQFEKLGYWSDGEVEREAAADGEDLLYARANMPDPVGLPSQTGSYRQALAILKEQAVRGIPITTSIGWRDDDDSPGGNDLLEVSIVGIAADPRTGTEGGEALIARAAVEAGADPEALVETVRAAVEGERPLGPPEDPDRFDTFEECVDALAEDPDLSREDAERICGAWEAAKQDQSHDMSETETQSADDADDTTDDEQHTDDGEAAETRAADDVTLQDFADLLAPSLAEADAADLMDAWEGFEYTGAVDLDAVAGFVSTVTDADMDATENALDDLMDGEQAEDEDDGEEEDDEDDEEEQSGDEPDDTQADDTSDLEARLADLEDELAAVRSGETAIDTPDDDADADEERAADDGEPGDTDQRENTDDTDPADKPAWAV